MGSIEVGKLADMIVLDKNILEIPPTEIGSAQVLRTVIGGDVVFERSTDPVGEGAIEIDLDLTGRRDHPACRF